MDDELTDPSVVVVVDAEGGNLEAILKNAREVADRFFQYQPTIVNPEHLAWQDREPTDSDLEPDKRVSNPEPRPYALTLNGEIVPKLFAGSYSGMTYTAQFFAIST